MSVPAWKKAIIDRRKKQEDDQKRKQAEEEAYLATLPPWKRALFQKREREKREQEERERSATAEESCERSNSFQQRQKQLAQEREQRNAPSTNRSWSRRVTPPSDDNESLSPSSPSYGLSHQFFPTTSTRTQPPSDAPKTQRRASVTTLPGLDTPIAEKVAKAPLPQSTRRSRPRSSSESAITSHKVVSSVRKFDEVKPQAGEMPAWKKALLQRRKEKAGHGQRDPLSGPRDSSTVAGSSLPVGRKESPLEETLPKKDKHKDSDAVSLLAVKRKSSPVEHTAVEPSLQLQRKQSPIEQVTDDSSRRSTPSPTVEVTHKSMAPQLSTVPLERVEPPTTESNSLAIDRRSSPLEEVGFQRTESPTGNRNNPASFVGKSHESKTAISSAVKTAPQKKSAVSEKLIPKRIAPVAPTATKQMQPRQTATSKNQERVASVKPQQRPAPRPEIVNRGSSEQPPRQNQVIHTEGVTHRAPVYREVEEWANVSEDDPKFRSLPTWKQALIKRRRADVAKRMGRTTSVDDVPLTNGPIPDNESYERSVHSEDRTAGIPLWKKQMIQKKAEGGLGGQMSSHEKKHLATRQESPPSSSAHVRALMGRFNARPLSPPISPPPRSPSPSSPSSPSHTEPSAASSRPAHSSSGVPQPPSSTAHTTRKTFTWSPAEDTMPGEELSDDSSEEDEGEQTVTNIDDVSSSEEGEGENESGANSGVVLLKPPQSVASPHTSEGKVRKTSSILVTDRPNRRVSCLYL